MRHAAYGCVLKRLNRSLDNNALWLVRRRERFVPLISGIAQSQQPAIWQALRTGIARTANCVVDPRSSRRTARSASAEGSIQPDEGSCGGLLSPGAALVFGAFGGVLFAPNTDSGLGIWGLPFSVEPPKLLPSFSINGNKVIAVALGRALFVLGL
jgi:hypothetical protein